MVFVSSLLCLGWAHGYGLRVPESERAPLVEAIKAAFAPVTHTIRIVPE
jgi:hypothetical protein